MPDFTFDLSNAEKRRIDEFITALRTECEVSLFEDSFFASSAFEEEFRSKLLTHHCFMGSPLFQESFEAAFVSACVFSGLEVEKAPEGQRFWDVAVNGKRISLKSTKAKNLRKNFIHISKLTEAAWIQDCRTAKKRRDETVRLFDEYIALVDSIVQLRYFQSTQFYEMVEIPVALFGQIADVGLIHFNSDGPSINIPVGQVPPDFTLKLDRSDAKITIAKLDKGLCVVHATWQL